MNSMHYPVNLTFDCNWVKIRAVYNHISKLKAQGQIHGVEEPTWDSNVFGLGSYGAIISDNQYLSDYEWNIWSGSLLESLVPDNLQKLSQAMLDANLRFVSYGFFSHQGEIREHVDKQIDKSVIGHCNINYIVSCTDPDAKTYLRDPVTGVEEFYPSVPGTAWLLNSAVPHRVSNNGIREVFQIKILSPFDEVKSFLNNTIDNLSI